MNFVIIAHIGNQVIPSPFYGLSVFFGIVLIVLHFPLFVKVVICTNRTGKSGAIIRFF